MATNNTPRMKMVLGTMTFGTKNIGEDLALQISKHFMDEDGTEFDTAYLYEDGRSEKILGSLLKKLPNELSTKAFIATKANPWKHSGGNLSYKKVVDQLNTSLKRLQVDQVDLFYLHAPDFSTPIEETLSAVHQLHQEGKFKELGLSNYAAWQVADIYRICEKNGWVLPTVYQGMYNVITRDCERELFPCLRKYNIRFYAFNPLAGGLLSGKYTYSEKPTEGRFAWRPLYLERYWKESMFKAVDILDEQCKKHNISMVDAALRWMSFHSILDPKRGDAIILGASSQQQFEDNIKYCKEAQPLPAEFVAACEEAWKITRADCPYYFKTS